MIFGNILIVAIASAFTIILIILGLVLVLMYAKTKLVPAGDAKVVVNNDADNPLIIPSGTNLLTALSENKLYLPSACGGGGTCAMCKCQIHEGGGDVLPTEKNHLSRKEQADNWRLACQVKVRNDMKIQVPEEVFGIQKWDCEVISNDNVATFIKDFTVKLPEGEKLEFEAGGYIQLYVPPCTVEYGEDIDVEKEYRQDWDESKLWNLKMVNEEEIFRAYSMANHPAEGSIIKLNIRIATPPWDRANNKFMDVNPGIASSYVFALKPKDKVTISGPYGDFFIKPTEKEMLFLGGGAGMAPFRSQIFDQYLTKKTSRKGTYWYGGRSKRELFYTEEFRDIEKQFPNFQYNIALSDPLPEDNWDGYTGFIHQVCYDNYLKHHKDPEEIEYYICGPPLMLQAALQMLEDMGIPEENIAFDDFG